MKKFIGLIGILFAVFLAFNAQSSPPSQHPGYQLEIYASVDVYSVAVTTSVVMPSAADMDIGVNYLSTLTGSINTGVYEVLIAARDVCTSAVQEKLVQRTNDTYITSKQTDRLLNQYAINLTKEVPYTGLIFFKINTWHSNLLTNTPFV